MRNTLNYHCLKALNACPQQVALFRRVFGNGDIFVTRRDMLKAHAAGLNTTWLWTTLSPAAYAGYRQARVLLWTEYARVAKNCQALAVVYAKYERARAVAISDAWRGDNHLTNATPETIVAVSQAVPLSNKESRCLTSS